MIICFIKNTELNDIIKGLPDERGFCELESPAEAKFIAFPDSEDYEKFTRGFIFNEDFELKWMKMNNQFHIVYTGTEEKLPKGPWQGKRDLEKIGEEHMYLWTNEKRVSRDLSYPIKGKKLRILVKTLKGTDKENEIYVKRFVKLEGKNER